MRGGAFYNAAWYVRCAFRLGYDPVINNRDDDIAFRVVLSPFPSEP